MRVFIINGTYNLLSGNAFVVVPDGYDPSKVNRLLDDIGGSRWFGSPRVVSIVLLPKNCQPELYSWARISARDLQGDDD